MNPFSDLTTLNYVNWGYGEPNNHNGEENCAVWCLLPELDESYWNDYFCYATKSYICQIPRGKDPAGNILIDIMFIIKFAMKTFRWSESTYPTSSGRKYGVSS